MPYRRIEPWYDNGQPCPPHKPDGGWDDQLGYEYVPEKPKPDLRPVVQRYKEKNDD